MRVRLGDGVCSSGGEILWLGRGEIRSGGDGGGLPSGLEEGAWVDGATGGLRRRLSRGMIHKFFDIFSQ